MGRCNWHSLQDLRAIAERQGKAITLVADPGGRLPGYGGTPVNVYIHENGVAPDTTFGTGDFVAWLMALPTECAC